MRRRSSINPTLAELSFLRPVSQIDGGNEHAQCVKEAGMQSAPIETGATPTRRRYRIQIGSLPPIYERPALRNSFAAFPADWKVARASFDVIATVVSMSDKLPPPAAARIADAMAENARTLFGAKEESRP